MTKTIAIVGGGLLGCLAALALVRRGHRIVLFERLHWLLQGASRNNEGKIHQGFTYGLDTSGATQELMCRYGAGFQSSLRQLLDGDAASCVLDERGIYAVERGSQLVGSGADAHVSKIAQMQMEFFSASGQPVGREKPYARRLSENEVRQAFGETIIAAYDVAEPSVDCDMLCDLVVQALLAEARIEVQVDSEIGGVSQRGRPEVMSARGHPLGQFDLVINAAWDGMPKLAATYGQRPSGLCLRAKTGFIAEVSQGMPEQPVTFCWGAYGDFVPQNNGTAYLSWYPSCLMGFTTNSEAGANWFDEVEREFDFAGAYSVSREAFEQRLPGLILREGPSVTRSGTILATATSDLDDAKSGLHRRTEIGLTQHDRVISVHTGKLTCAPELALRIAELV